MLSLYPIAPKHGNHLETPLPQRVPCTERYGVISLEIEGRWSTGMKSLTRFYNMGPGPSSTGTIAPRRAAGIFGDENLDAARFRVTLYGLLAEHHERLQTDRVVKKALAPRDVEFVYVPGERPDDEPFGMLFEAFDAGGEKTDEWLVFGKPGGELADRDNRTGEQPDVYEVETLGEITSWWIQNSRESLMEYVLLEEGDRIRGYLAGVWRMMLTSMERGMSSEGILPAVGTTRMTSRLVRNAEHFEESFQQKTALVCAMALAVAEENAAGGVVVTAPTCCSAGVVPAVLRYLYESFRCSEHDILTALAVGGLVGNIVKHRGSISGADAGCQGEIGTACAMAAAAAVTVMGGTPLQMEYAAAAALDHYRDTPCVFHDRGCMERNAAAAMDALGFAAMALASEEARSPSFDEIVEGMGKNPG